MLRFKNYLSEEVLPTAGVKDGGIDIENNAVRAQINATLSNVTAQPAVTPYIVLHRISKALAYFHIILPKRAYLEGDRGVEVIEVKQFGHKMGMTNDGQFVHDVPSKYFLFISYRLASSMGADYSAVGDVLSSVGGMFKVTAKLVDEVELQRLLSMAEVSLAESCDAETQQSKAKAMAPKEMMHTALGDCDCSQGDSPSTKSAVSTMMRKTDKKLSADSLDEDLMNEKRGLWDNIHAKRARIKAGSGEKMRKPGSKGAPSSDDIKLARNEEVEEIDEASYDKLDKYVRKAHVSGTGAAARGEIAMHRGQKTRLHRANKTGEKREQGINLALDKMAGRALVPAKRKEKMEEAYGVFRKGGSIGEKPSKEPHKTFDSAEEAKSHAKGMNKQLSPGEKKYYRIKYHVKPIKEEQINEVSKGAAIRAYGASQDPDGDYGYRDADTTGERLMGHIVRKFGKKAGEHAERHATAMHYGRSSIGKKVDDDKPGERLTKNYPDRVSPRTGKKNKHDVERLKTKIKVRLGKHTNPKHLPEEQIDEVSLATAAKTARQRNIGAERSAHASPYDYSPHIDVQKRKAGKTVDRIARKYGDDKAKKVSDKMEKDTDKVWRGKMDEKLTKAMSAGDVISDFVHSKDPRFEGESKKMRQKMALGAYYGMHPEKSKLDEASRLKKTTAHRKFATGVNTKTREALGSKSDESKTILVTRKGDPRAAAGGGVRRIPKEKFDPAIYNRASE